MRFEAKHNFFKCSVKNFKNVTKTLVKAHQSHMAFYWETFNFQRFEHGPICLEIVSYLEGCEIICDCLELSDHNDAHTTNWVKCFGNKYHMGLFVCCAVESDMPVFKKIINIVLKDGCAYFLLGEVLTLGFHDHFSAYCIQERPSPFVIVSVKSWFYYEAFDKQYAYNSDGNMYLIPNCHLF